MLEVILNTLSNWNATKSERQKLQHAYLALTLIIVFAAGIISLFNASYGHNAVRLALIALGAFVVNAFIWNLLQSVVIARLPSKSKRK